MTIPNTISFSQINNDQRKRSTYSGIELLAESIADHGLIQPLVLVPLEEGFGLDAGGRRYQALNYLLTSDRWDGILHHASTSEPGKPGFVLKGEAQATPLQRLLTTIAENLDREDPDWRDQCHWIVEAWRMVEREHRADPTKQKIVMRDGGVLLGVPYMDLCAAVAVDDDLRAHPNRYESINSLRGAYTKLLDINRSAVAKVQAAKSIIKTPLKTAKSISVSPQSEAEQGEAYTVPLSQAFINVDAIAFMSGLSDSIFDHIITDPDYGVSVERLAASVGGASLGVHQETVLETLDLLAAFFPQAFRVIRPQGFCVVWYDHDHHEKIASMAIAAGFRVQRWPLIWEKSDYRANASPQHNFCKNYECAMVCRKPNAVLAKVQMSSIFRCASSDTVKMFGHPFAKPIDVTKWILQAVAIKDQIVYDPFFGSAAISCACVDFGVRPVGTEISTDHFANGIVNLQTYYRKLLGPNTKFA